MNTAVSNVSNFLANTGTKLAYRIEILDINELHRMMEVAKTDSGFAPCIKAEESIVDTETGALIYPHTSIQTGKKHAMGDTIEEAVANWAGEMKERLEYAISEAKKARPWLAFAIFPPVLRRRKSVDTFIDIIENVLAAPEKWVKTDVIDHEYLHGSMPLSNGTPVHFLWTGSFDSPMSMTMEKAQLEEIRLVSSDKKEKEVLFCYRAGRHQVCLLQSAPLPADGMIQKVASNVRAFLDKDAAVAYGKRALEEGVAALEVNQ